MNRIVLTLKTDRELFANWLTSYASDRQVYYAFPTGYDQDVLYLQSPDVRRRGIEVDVTFGGWVRLSKTPETPVPMYDLIRFDLTPIGDGRLTVIAECQYEPAILAFLDILTAMGERWPEARDTLKAELARLDLVEQLARGDKPTPKGGAGTEADPLTVIEDADLRELVRQWNEGHTAEDIAKSAGISAGRLRNILTDLRKRYGAEIVHYHRS